jgi:hypothetical protein
MTTYDDLCNAMLSNILDDIECNNVRSIRTKPIGDEKLKETSIVLNTVDTSIFMQYIRETNPIVVASVSTNDTVFSFDDVVLSMDDWGYDPNLGRGVGTKTPTTVGKLYQYVRNVALPTVIAKVTDTYDQYWSQHSSIANELTNVLNDDELLWTCYGNTVVGEHKSPYVTRSIVVCPNVDESGIQCLEVNINGYSLRMRHTHKLYKAIHSLYLTVMGSSFTARETLSRAATKYRYFDLFSTSTHCIMNVEPAIMHYGFMSTKPLS